MTKHEMVTAMMAGKKLRLKADDATFALFDENSDGSPFRFINAVQDEDLRIWYGDHWEILAEPKMRHMTRDEVLGFVCNTPGIVVRYKGAPWGHPGAWGYIDPVDYEWTTISPDGEYGEPHEFETEVKE